MQPVAGDHLQEITHPANSHEVKGMKLRDYQDLSCISFKPEDDMANFNKALESPSPQLTDSQSGSI